MPRLIRRCHGRSARAQKCLFCPGDLLASQRAPTVLCCHCGADMVWLRQRVTPSPSCTLHGWRRRGGLAARAVGKPPDLPYAFPFLLNPPRGAFDCPRVTLARQAPYLPELSARVDDANTHAMSMLMNEGHAESSFSPTRRHPAATARCRRASGTSLSEASPLSCRQSSIMAALPRPKALVFDLNGALVTQRPAARSGQTLQGVAVRRVPTQRWLQLSHCCPLAAALPPSGCSPPGGCSPPCFWHAPRSLPLQASCFPRSSRGAVPPTGPPLRPRL